MADEPRDTESLDRLAHILWRSCAPCLAAALLAATAGVAGWTGLTALFAAVGICVLIFLAAFATGALIGFLFGVPRTLSSDRAIDHNAATDAESAPAGVPAPASGDRSASARRARPLHSNTNLEKISDWLTTLLVGASLTQLNHVNDGLVAFRDCLANYAKVFDATGNASSAGMLPVAGPIVLISGVACDFLFMYLNTRLVLITLFYAIERQLTGTESLAGDTTRGVQAVIRSEERPSFISSRLGEKRRLTVDDALGLMFDLHYKDTPDAVIEIGGQLDSSPAARRAGYWFYLAAAFGQKMARTASVMVDLRSELVRQRSRAAARRTSLSTDHRANGLGQASSGSTTAATCAT